MSLDESSSQKTEDTDDMCSKMDILTDKVDELLALSRPFATSETGIPTQVSEFFSILKQSLSSATFASQLSPLSESAVSTVVLGKIFDTISLVWAPSVVYSRTGSVVTFDLAPSVASRKTSNSEQFLEANPTSIDVSIYEPVASTSVPEPQSPTRAFRTASAVGFLAFVDEATKSQMLSSDADADTETPRKSKKGSKMSKSTSKKTLDVPAKSLIEQFS